eukprot:4931474-Pyramimonas_sp.AAC.1
MLPPILYGRHVPVPRRPSRCSMVEGPKAAVRWVHYFATHGYILSLGVHNWLAPRVNPLSPHPPHSPRSRELSARRDMRAEARPRRCP